MKRLPYEESGWWLFLFWAAIAWLGSVGWRGWQSGRIRWRNEITERDKEPTLFWTTMGILLLFLLCLTSVTIYLTAKWIGANL